jgi:2-dehydropantoate 2-reductase
MLQDVEAGRAPELEALVGSVMELGRLTQTRTPHIDTVYGLTHLLARTVAAPQAIPTLQERTAAPPGHIPAPKPPLHAPPGRA